VLVSYCRKLCEAGKEGVSCWSNVSIYSYDSCAPGSHFCDFASDEEFAINFSGTCKACPSDPDECHRDGFVASLEGKRNCLGCTVIFLEVFDGLTD
jgi:hypothetical protein